MPRTARRTLVFLLAIAIAGTAVTPAGAQAPPPISFAPSSNLTFPLGVTPQATASGPLTPASDPHLDLVVAQEVSGSPDQFQLMLGAGTGGFTPGSTLPVGDGPQDIEVGLLNADAFPDVVTVNADAPGSLSVYLGNGSGGFQQATGSPIAVGGTPSAAVLGELDGDGITDIAVANESANAIDVLLGEGDGSFAPAPGSPVDLPTDPSPVAITAGNFTGDALTDLAVAGPAGGGTVVVALNQGGGTFAVQTPFASGGNPTALATADLDTDGVADLAVANGTAPGTVSLFRGDNAGGFTPIGVPPQVGANPAALDVADLNGDGQQDVVTANATANTASALLGEGNGAFAAAQSFALGGQTGAQDIDVADLRGNGSSDLVVTNAGAQPGLALLLGVPAPTFAPAAVAFGTQPVNTESTTRTVTVSNPNTGTLDMSNVSLGGANPGQFAITGQTCTAQPIEPGGTCQVVVRFDPTAEGPQSASLLFADNAAGSPQSVPLTGTGAAPLVGFSPAGGLAFGNRNVGSTTILDAFVENTGNAELRVTGVSIANGQGAFSIERSLCGNVAPGHRCEVRVRFHPTAPGPVAGTLQITDNAAGSPQSLPLTGTGAAPAIAVAPGSLAFGNQPVGTQSAAQTVTVTNTGTANLTVGNLNLAGSGAREFAIVGQNCLGAPVAPGAACQVNVAFSPGVAGPALAALQVHDNAGPFTNVPLSGTGATAIASLAPTTLAFGSIAAGRQSAVRTVTVTSGGNAPLAVSAVQLTGADTGQFRLVSQTCTRAPVAPAGTCQVRLRFAPTATGTQTATLQVSDNAAGSPQTVALSGSGASPVTLASRTIRTTPAGRAPVRLTCRSARRCIGSLTLRSGTRGIGRALFRVNPARTQTVSVALTAAGRALLRSRARLAVRAVVVSYLSPRDVVQSFAAALLPPASSRRNTR